jgi:hypothetical protein
MSTEGAIFIFEKAASTTSLVAEPSSRIMNGKGSRQAARPLFSGQGCFTEAIRKSSSLTKGKVSIFFET